MGSFRVCLGCFYWKILTSLVVTGTSEQALPCDLDFSCTVTVFRGEAEIPHICLLVVLLILSWKHHVGHLLDRMWLLMHLYYDQIIPLSPPFLKKHQYKPRASVCLCECLTQAFSFICDLASFADT